MASSFFALFDDIATLLDDISLMTKVAAKKTAGVLGDDLAVNAEQVSGVRADRELPVVWAVTKGSFKNKLILVPLAMLISAFIPWLILPLLILGGFYLCYEGMEKWVHDLRSSKHPVARPALAQHTLSATDVLAFEKKKIRGAIRTDFVLSIEIIVIALGTVKDADLITQIISVSLVAFFVTVGVYGLVAVIVKLDDAGLALIQSSSRQGWGKFTLYLGSLIVTLAPWLMKSLSVIGTLAMFLVGGGILFHHFPLLQHIIYPVLDTLAATSSFGPILSTLSALGFELLTGLVIGALTVALASVVRSLVRTN